MGQKWEGSGLLLLADPGFGAVWIESRGALSLLRLGVMAPESQDFHDPFFLHDLVNETVLDVDPTGTSAFQVAHQCFIGGRLLVGINFEQTDQAFRFAFQGWCSTGQFACIFLSLAGEQHTPGHQPGSSLSSVVGVAMPSKIDSRIPGTVVR